MLSLLLAFASTLASTAQEQPAPATVPLPTAPPAQAQRQVHVQSREGAWSPRPLSGFEFSALGDLKAIAVRVDPPPGPRAEGPASERANLRLGEQDWVVARIASAAGEALQLELAGGGRLEVAIDDVLSIAFVSRLAGAPPLPPERGDRLYWLRPRGVDRVDGSFQEFSAEGVVFDSALGVRAFPWSEVGALMIEPLGARSPAARSAKSVSVDLALGGRLHGELERVEQGVAHLRWRGGASLALALDALDQIVLDDGSVSHLSASAPARALEGWPPDDDSGMRWPYQLDRSVMGGPLRAGGKVWTRGVGVHAPSRLEWELDGSWKALHGAVAIDDSVELLAYRGSVQCAIYLDGAEAPVWRSGRIEGGTAPTSFGAIDLSGVRRVALQVEMDERLYVADRLDWLDLRLVK
jgi:hypothetical protein